MKYYLCFLGLFFVSITAVSSEEFDRIIMKVGHEVITQSDIDEALFESVQEIKNRYPSTEWAERTEQLKNQILMHIVDELVCVSAAHELKISVVEEEIDAQILAIRGNAGIKTDSEFHSALEEEGRTLEEFRKTVKRQLLARKVLQSEVYSKVRITESDIQKYYNEHLDMFREPERFKIAILFLIVESASEEAWVLAEKKIRDLAERVKNGESFEALVASYSEGPAKDQGGDIGYIEKGKTLPEFETALKEVNVGACSEPFKTQQGWNIVKLLDHQEAHVRDVQEESQSIRDLLRRSRISEAEQTWIETQRSKTFIERINK